MKRCHWVNLNNQNYIDYHDKSWGRPLHNDHDLIELLILEAFQAGLSWECIINKREDFKEAFDDYDINKIVNYDQNKINELLKNKRIIRNKLKINATINNCQILKEIIKEYNSFDKYIWHFTNYKTIRYKRFHTTSKLSDTISKDLIKRGMKFVGSTIIYSYLEAIGILNHHEKDCYLYKENI